MSLNEQQNQTPRVSLAPSLVANASLSPLSFKEWIDFYKGVIPGQEFRQYNEYLVEWYNDNSLKATSALTELQISYLFLLKQLQVFFQKKDLENWYVNIDISNEKELLLAIPYFAKKLKEISLYYLKLRSTIKDNQIKYKLVGTPEGTNQEVQDLVLTHFTKKPGFIQTIPAEIWANVPELSSITEPISLEIEELYDTFNYMDHSYSMPVSAYYNLSDEATNNFFTSIGLDFKNDTWIFNTGIFNNELSAQIVENIDLNDRIFKKYLGSEKITISPIVTSNNVDIIDLLVTEGNNYFYWPAGAYKGSLANLPFYEPIPLSSTKIENIATGSDKFSDADTLYIKTINGIEGAWLRKEFFTEKPATMNCTIRRAAKTQFRFPYPGYGLSGEDLPWTGFSLETNKRYNYLNNEYKQAINNVYWTTSFDITGSQPIPINSTTLVDNKAQADTNYEFADKIRIWSNPPAYTEQIYNGLIDEAWLFKVKKTDISIAEKTDSTILWPFQKINPNDLYPEFTPVNLTNYCTERKIQSINFPYSIASNTLSAADSIYFVQNYTDTKDQATTCAWLSGKEIFYPETNITAVLQPGLVIKAEPGTYTKFLWQGNNNVDADDVFVSYNHQSDCPYSVENKNFEEINICTCKQPLFTPFGHPGNLFTDNQQLADFIIEDFNQNEDFDITDWTDDQNRTYLESSCFGWFKTNKNIGWGNGKWIDGTGSQFQLRQGRSYIYYRNSGKKTSTEITTLSSLVVRYSYDNFTEDNFSWIKAKQQSDGTWINTNNRSKVSFQPGDIFIYSRQPQTSFSFANTKIQTQTVQENKNSIWTSFDYATVGETITLSYPLETIYLKKVKQYPEVDITNFVSVFMWGISSQVDNEITYFKNQPSVTFLIPTTGLYSFSVTAISASGLPPQTRYLSANNTFVYLNTGFYIFSAIPLLTALPTQIEVTSLTSFNTPSPGFVLNARLYGWNYQTYQNDFNNFSNESGARPLWVKSSLTETNLNFSRLETLGSSLRLVDNHNLISFPEFSDISLEAGMFVEYERSGNFDINWSQALTLKLSSEKNIWSKIDYKQDSNLKNIVKGDTVDNIVIPTTATSPMLLQTYVDNEPIEVYYNAKSSFIWNITATPLLLRTSYSDITASTSINVIAPSKNLSNRYYPNVAILPTLQSLSSQSDLGGYFTPSNLGVIQYLDKDYTVTTITSSANSNKLYENPKEYISGTGSTKQEQTSPYQIEAEDSTWLKEPPIAGPIAGTIKKNIFKKYPKFIPYQSVIETSNLQKLGIITQDSLQTPWTGPQDTDWGDPNNKPISFTGQINVKTWVDSQILKRTTLQLENWCTDIYNNQYGLYKPTKNVTLADKKYIPGELWVRKNSQKVYPASTGLSGIFDTYQGISLINELTGLGIRHIETFFDVLYVQTSGSVIFEKINYDYDTDQIFSLIDNARYLSLAQPIFTNLDREFNLSAFNTQSQIISLPGETWFFPIEKNIIQSTCALSGNILIPELYRYNSNTLSLQKVFPLSQNDILTINELTALNIQKIEAPLLTYNNINKQYILTINTTNLNSDNIHIDLKINDSVVQLTLDSITVYTPLPSTTLLEPPAINSNLHITSQFTVPFAAQVQVLNGFATFTTIDWPSWVSMSESGAIEGRPPAPGFYTLPFYATNDFGTTYSCFTLFVAESFSLEDRYISRDTATFYNDLSSILTQQDEPLITN